MNRNCKGKIGVNSIYLLPIFHFSLKMKSRLSYKLTYTKFGAFHKRMKFNKELKFKY